MRVQGQFGTETTDKYAGFAAALFDLRKGHFGVPAGRLLLRHLLWGEKGTSGKAWTRVWFIRDVAINKGIPCAFRHLMKER